MKKKLKIAIFHLAFFYSGGGEKLVLDEIRELEKRGHSVDCFTPTIDEKLCFPEQIKGFRIKRIFPAFFKFLPHSESLDILFASIFFPFIAFRFSKYDVILGANQPGPWFAFWLKKIYNKPYLIYLAQPTRILYPRNIDKEVGIWVKQKSYILPSFVKIFKPLIKSIDKLSIKYADEMLVNGKYMLSILEKVYERKGISCPAGAKLIGNKNINRWEGELRINKLRIRKPYILLTNRHFPQKRFEFAINAIREIVRKNPNISLVITGNATNYTERLRELVKKYSLQKNIVFSGYAKSFDLEKLYVNSAVYCYTSPEEDFGMGIIEAMGAGIPVVAWDKGGPSKTIIDNKTGFLVKPYFQKKFVEKLNFLLANIKENQKMGENAYNHIGENFTHKNHVDILENSFLKLLDVKSFDYETKIWGWEKPSSSFLNHQRQNFLYLSSEVKKLGKNKKIRILDLGCGGGGLVKALKKTYPALEFYACDLSKNAINRAKKKSLGVKFYANDIEKKLPFKNNFFDLVYMNSVLDHLENPKKGIEEVSRILRKKGIFLSLTPIEGNIFSFHGILSKFKKFRKHRLRYLGHFHAFNRKSLSNLIKKEGFSIEKINYDWFYFAQFIDISYYFLNSTFFKNPQSSVDGYIMNNKNKKGRILKNIRNFFILIQNLESFLIPNLPIGFFCYVKAVKK